MVGRSEAEAREVAAELTGRPGAELALERGECLSWGGMHRGVGYWASGPLRGADPEMEKVGSGKLGMEPKGTTLVSGGGGWPRMVAAVV